MQSRGRTSNRQTPTGAAGTCGELNIVTFTGVDAILPKSYSGVTLTVNGSGLGSQAACQAATARVTVQVADGTGWRTVSSKLATGTWAPTNFGGFFCVLTVATDVLASDIAAGGKTARVILRTDGTSYSYNVFANAGPTCPGGPT